MSNNKNVQSRRFQDIFAGYKGWGKAGALYTSLMFLTIDAFEGSQKDDHRNNESVVDVQVKHRYSPVETIGTPLSIMPSFLHMIVSLKNIEALLSPFITANCAVNIRTN